MADMTPIMEIAARHGIPVIEDACQAHGAEYHGKRAGSIGVSGCFSFYPGKNLGACGEGGLAVTNDDATAAKIRMLRDWGQEQRYHHTLKGFNYRMDGIQGAILRVKLRHLEKWTEARRTNARLYTTLLKNVEAVAAPTEAADRRHVYHIYAVRSDDREALRQSLDAAGIATGLHYPIPVHLQKAHADLGHRKGDFPVSEKLASEVLSVPLYPELTSEQIATVVDAIAEATTAKPARAALRVG
jgi:dTDP-4-amino-4,6-dideoxygalactose transaminase